MAKIIVAAPPLTGELTPLLGIGEGLAARGHQITVVTGSRFRAEVERAGLAFEPVSGQADFDVRVLFEERARANLTPGPEMLNWDWIHAFINPVADLHATLQRLLERDPDQLLVANVVWLGAWPTAFGAPGLRPRRWVGVSAVPLVLSSRDTTFFGPAPVAPGEDPRQANQAANAQFAAAFAPTESRLNELLAAAGATRPLSGLVDSVVTLPDATAVLTVPGVEFARSDAPDSIRLVGVLPGPGANGWQRPSWWAELDGSRPVVTVTQGTIANHDLSELVEPTLTGLAGLDVTVVAALGRDPEALSVPLPANAHAAEFIPFTELLPKTDVLITNGGFGGAQQALAAGVPVIVAGLTEDKPATAARVAQHGLGVDLATSTPTPEAVAAAARSVLADTVMHASVARIAEVYAAHDAVAEVEALLLA